MISKVYELGVSEVYIIFVFVFIVWLLFFYSIVVIYKGECFFVFWVLVFCSVFIVRVEVVLCVRLVI